VVEFKIGGYKPLIDREASLTGKPYEQTFGASSMILVEVEVDKLFYQGIGEAGVGLSIGYAEKYASATVAQQDPNAPPQPANESTSLKVLPLHLLLVYKMDYAALHYNVPLTPYVKAALVYIPWWSSKAGELTYVDGNRAAGGKWGYGFTAGLALLLDFFEPRLARDFDSDLGVNHTYLFGEYVYENVNNFGKRGLDLSSRRWMFGLALEF
jgi:hypothetical protein